MPEASEYTGLSIGLAAFIAAIALAALGSTSEATTPGVANGYPSFVGFQSANQVHGNGPIAVAGGSR